MKKYLSVSLISVLMACAEPNIRSVDDETMEKATAKNAEANLKNEQTAVLGTWLACKEVSESESIQYEYSFATDGQASLRKNTFASAKCANSAESFTAENLRLKYKIETNNDSTFKLIFDLDAGKNLQSQYALNATEESRFPNVFELKDQKDIKLVDLKKDEDKFISFTKVPPGEAEKYRLLAEKNVLTFVSTLLQQDGTWESRCFENKQAVLKFTVKDQKLSFTHSIVTFKNDSCTSPSDSATSPVPYTMTFDSVPDPGMQKVQTTLTRADEPTKIKGGILASLTNFNLIIMSDFADSKKSVPYEFKRTAGESK